MKIDEETIISILKDIKLFAFDMDGVLRIGNHPVEGSDKIFKNLEKLNKINNNYKWCRYTRYQRGFTEMGKIGNTPVNCRYWYLYLFKKGRISSRSKYIFRYCR